MNQNYPYPPQRPSYPVQPPYAQGYPVQQAPVTPGDYQTPVQQPQGYGQPVYPQVPYAQPVQPYAVPQNYMPPAFAIGGTRPFRLTDASKSFNRMCLLLLLQMAAAFALELPLMGLMMVAGIDILMDSIGFQLFAAALVPLTTALPFFIYLRVGHKETEQYLRFEKVGFGWGLMLVLAGVCCCILGNFPAFGVQEFFGNFGYESAGQFTNTDVSWPLVIIELLSTAVLVPIMEEFAFRGVIFSALKKHGTGFAIVGSALIFAVAHLDFSTVVFALIAGLTMGYIYAKTRNLWVTVCIHAINNGLAVLGNYAEFLFGDSGEFAAGMMMLIPIVVGGAAMLLLAIFRYREIFTPVPAKEGEPIPLRPSEAAGCIVRTPLFWVSLSFVVAYTAFLFF